MPLTTRRGFRALASGLLVAGIGWAFAAPAIAAPRPDAPEASTRLASSSTVTPGTGPLSVSILMPIVVPPTTTGLIPAEDLELYTAPFGTLSRQLDAVAGTPVALGVDPMVLASIRVLGSAAPPSAAAWLARLEALSNEVFTLAYADADVVGAARTGTLAALTPTGFGFALDPDDFTPVATPDPTAPPTATPTPSADPDQAPPFPTTDQLLAWSSSLPAIAWPADEVVAAADLEPLAAAGYTEVLVSSELLDATTSPLAALGDLRGIVVDSASSIALRSATGAISEADRASSIAALDAALDAQAAAAPGRGLVLTLGRGWPAGLTNLSDTLAHLQGSASAQLVTLGDILATTPVEGVLGEAEGDTEREQVYTSLAEDAAREETFSTVLVDPAPLLDPRRLERIALYAVGWQPNASGWNEAVTAFHGRSEEIVTSVRIERGSDVVLLARNTDFRVAVSNKLPFPVTVRVGITSQSPVLRPQGDVELTVEPEATGTAYIKVEAVANGDVVVQAQVHSPTGVPIDSAYIKVTAQAEWEGIGTTVVALLLLLVFGAGILRIVVTRRRARAELEAADAAPEAPSEDVRG